MGDAVSRILPSDDDDLTPALYVGSLDFIVRDAVIEQAHIQAVVSCFCAPPQGIHEVLQRHKIDLQDDYRVYHLEDNSDYFVSMMGSDNDEEDEGREKGGRGSLLQGDDGAVGDPALRYTHIIPVLDFIHSKRHEGKTVLVHCDQGLTRSPAVCIAYMLKYGMDLYNPIEVGLKEAKTYVCQRREKARVRLFQGDLEALEKHLRAGPAAAPSGPTSARGLHNPSVCSDEAGPTSPSRIGSHINCGILRQSWILANQNGENTEMQDVFYRELFRVGGPSLESMFATVSQETKARKVKILMDQLTKTSDLTGLPGLAQLHRHLQLKDENFGALRSAIHRTLETTLQSEYTEARRWVWNSAMDVVFLRFRVYLQIDVPDDETSITSPAAVPPPVGEDTAGNDERVATPSSKCCLVS